MENMEIERKWLIEKVPMDLEGLELLLIEQAYLSISPTVRVRKENATFYLTYKGLSGLRDSGAAAHTEYNLPLTEEAYEHLKEKHDGILISKKRYLIPLEDGHTIELDIFDPPIAPLMIAEVEFESLEEAEDFKAPDWFGLDVSTDPRYKNAFLAMEYKS